MSPIMVRRLPMLTPALAVAVSMFVINLPTAHAQTSELPAVSSGQNMSVNLRVSTLGFGLEAGKLLTSRIAVRAGANMFSYDRTQNISDIDYDASIKFRNFSALVDLFPSQNGSFHFTGGLYKNSNKISAVAVPSEDGTITMNDNEYEQSDIGTLTGEIAFPSVSPYLGLGWGSPVRKGSRIRMVFDLGVVIGAPTVKLNASGASTNPSLAADLKEQEAKSQSDVDKFAKFWPLISLGLAFHF